jgi:hypothetical protein
VQQPLANLSRIVRRCTHEQHTTAQSFAYQAAQERIRRTGEAQVHDLRVRIQGRNQRPCKRKGIASGGIGIGLHLPARLEQKKARRRRDSHDSLAIIGDRRDDARDLGAMTVALELLIVRVDEVDGGGNVGLQVCVPGVGSRVDDRDFDSLAARPGMSAGDVHLLKASLQLHVGIIVVFAARRKTLQRLRELDAVIVRQRSQQSAPIHAGGDLEHGAVHAQWRDRPCAHFA